MFEKNYEKRLEVWSQFRNSLEYSNTPLHDVINFYKNAPSVSIQVNPWNKETWPDPWQLVHENQYDDFCCILGMYYSLQLTDRFKQSNFEIHICTLNSLGYLYLLRVEDYVLGFDNDKPILYKQLSKDIHSQQVYRMSEHYKYHEI